MFVQVVVASRLVLIHFEGAYLAGARHLAVGLLHLLQTQLKGVAEHEEVDMFGTLLVHCLACSKPIPATG